MYLNIIIFLTNYISTLIYSPSTNCLTVYYAVTLIGIRRCNNSYITYRILLPLLINTYFLFVSLLHNTIIISFYIYIYFYCLVYLTYSVLIIPTIYAIPEMKVMYLHTYYNSKQKLPP